MNYFSLIDNWQVADIEAVKNYKNVPNDSIVVSLPYDALTHKSRDKSVVLGYQNSYYPSVVSCFFNKLPSIKNAYKIWLQCCGVTQSCDIFISDKFVVSIDNKQKSAIFDITEHYIDGATIAFRIATHPDSSEYIGNGIMEKVSVIATDNKCYIELNSTNIVTNTIKEKTTITAFCVLRNDTNQIVAHKVGCEILKSNGKKLVKKDRVIKIAANSSKLVDVSLKVTNATKFSIDNPYVYTANFLVDDAPQATNSFGVVSHKHDKGGYKLNNRFISLSTGYVKNNNAFLGAATRHDFELRKFTELKKIGYSSIAFLSIPASTTLGVLDSLGLLCEMSLLSSKKPFEINDTVLNNLYNDIKVIRNHPCIMAYSISNALGKHVVDKVIEEVAKLDSKRPVLVSVDDELPKCAADYLGKEIYGDEVRQTSYTEDGDIDVLAKTKAVAVKTAAVIGKTATTQILVQDPDSVSPNYTADDTTDAHALWNWPRHDGQDIKVIVHTSGDIVSLNLNGKQIARKLAGKFSNHKAVFVIPYTAGVLEAISYSRGVEQSRNALFTVKEAKAVSLSSNKKNVKINEYAYIDVSILDNMGHFIPYAGREVRIQLPKELEFIASQNIDPQGNVVNTDPNSIFTFDGHATIAVKALAVGKHQVKVLGDRLNVGKINILVS